MRLAGLLRPLVQREWAARVCRYNRSITDAAGDLEAFLFGADRLGAVRIRLALFELQGARCFYSGERLRRPADARVDHFLPWARYPTDAIQNLVVASTAANAAKRAHLASVEHLARWRRRFIEQGQVLEQVATANRWPSHPDTTLSVARAIYLRLRDGVPLWVAGREFRPADREQIRRSLAA
jgi:hypothetical protein